MYLSLLGNLRLWSVITNESSYGKIRHVEVESLNREIRHSIDLYRLVVIIYIYHSGIASGFVMNKMGIGKRTVSVVMYCAHPSKIMYNVT